MAQKTLLSFFKKAPVTVSSPQVSVDEPLGKVKEECPNDSPVKQPNKRRRFNPIIDSDEDEPISSVDITKDSSHKSSDSKMESKNTEGKHVRSNEKSISFAEQDNSNNEAGNKDSTSPISKPVNGDVHKNGSGISIENGEPRVHTTQNICPDFIPKRKTARKQMRGGLKPKAKSPNEPTSSIDSKLESVAESNSDDKDKVSDQEVSTNNEEKMEVDKSSGESDGENKNSNCSQELNKDYSDSCEADTVKKSSPKTSKKVLKPASKKKEKSAKSKVSSKSAKGRQQRIYSEDDESDADKDSSSEHCLTGANSIDKEDSKKNSDPQSSKEKPAIHPFFASKKNDNGSSEGSEEGPAKSSSSGSSSSKEESKTSLSSSSENGYNPSKSPYHPIDDACWKHGEKVPYHALAKTLELIENISGRLQMIEILSNFLRSVIVLTPDDLIHCVYLCLNRLAPEYEGIELGVGESLLMRAVAQATGRTVDKIKAEVAVKGDLGLVAESSRGNQRVMFAPPKLTVSSVFAKFKEIAKMSGNSAMAKKTDKIQVLLVACRDCEAKYIIRSLSGKLRIGLAEQSVLAGLARAAVMTPPNQSYPPEIIDKSSKMSTEKFKTYLTAQTLILKTTYCECPNYDLIIPVLLKEGIDALPEHCQLTPGCPLKPMLAQPTNGIAEVLNRFDKNEFTCEFKYDGERAQIHMTEKGEVKIFSRNQEDNTSKYPDVISRISSVLHESTKTFILDSEAVAWDKETKQILPFQVLSTRKRKDAVESDIVVQVCIMAFDLLYLNGESLVKKTLKERRALLHSSFVEVPNEFMFVNYKDGNSAETMQEYLDESIKGNCEGLMVKALTVDASYEIAKRSHNWLKLKKDYLKGIGDTLDLVVIGGYHGKGKRAGTYGGFLLACYDEENEEFQSICKLGTGFSEEELETHTKFLKEHVINEPRSYYRYDSSLEPDEWFDAVQIWEIKCADLSISPVHKAAQGIVDPEKGISLRFPRFLRIREDKTKPEDCTSASQIAGMYQNQEQVQNMTKNKNVKTDEDYY